MKSSHFNPKTCVEWISCVDFDVFSLVELNESRVGPFLISVCCGIQLNQSYLIFNEWTVVV